MHKIIINISMMILLLYGHIIAQKINSWPEEVDAVVLLDENEFEVKNDTKANFRRHRKVVVYNEKGKKYGQVQVQENTFTKCKHLSGTIKDLNGKVIKKLKKENIHTANISPGFILYDDNKYHWFKLEWNCFPYIVEYTFELEFKTLFAWPAWYPQDDVPVLESTYTLMIEKNIAYKTHSIGMDVEPRVTEGKKTEFIWEMENIEPRIKEDMMAPEDNIQMALFFAPNKFKVKQYEGSYNSWEDFASWYYNLAKGRYVLSGNAKSQVRKIISQTNNNIERIQKLYAYLQNNTRYVAIELGVGSWQPYSAQSVFENRYGDCKDLSTFLIAMLNEAGIKAYPALILTRNQGVVFEEFPYNRFNHCITFVPLQKDSLWIDNTVDYTHAMEVTQWNEGCNALVVKEEGGQLVRIPQSKADENFQTNNIKATLTSSGMLKFYGSMTFAGNQNKRRYLNYKKPEERKLWLTKRLGEYVPKVDLENHTFENLTMNLEKPLIVRFKGTVGDFSKYSANRIFLNPNFLHRNIPNLINDKKERQFPIHYDYAYTDSDSFIISMPEGFVMEAAPEPLQLSTSFGFFKSTYTFINGTLQYNRTFKCKQTKIPSSKYEEYVVFMKKVAKSDREQFVFKKSI